MRSRLLARKFHRDLRADWVKAAVSMIIVALGVSGYFSYTQEARNLEASYRSTYDELELADQWVELASPAPQAAFEVLEAEPEVEVLQPRLHLYGRFFPPETAARNASDPVAFQEIGKLAEILGSPSDRRGLNRLRILEGVGLEADHSALRAQGLLPVVLERQVILYHGLELGGLMRLSLPLFDPLAALGALNGSGHDLANVTPYQLGGGAALTFVNVTAQVVGVAISPEHLVVTGNEGVLVPRPRSVGVFFVELADLQNATNLTALPGYTTYGGFVNEAALKLGGEGDLAEILSRPGPSPLQPLVYQTKGRGDQHSVMILQQDLEGFRQLTPPLSGLVLAVAGFTIAMNLQRIVASQRRQIGVLRALGASSTRVLVYYGAFALVIGLVGSLLGLALGFVQADYLTSVYARALGLPEVELHHEPGVALQAAAFGILMALLFGLTAARRAAHLLPREAMTQAHPDRFSPTLAGLTRGRSLPTKLALRNLARNRSRTLLTVGGLSFALILPLSLGGILGSFDTAIENMFDHPRWDGTAIFATAQPQAPATAELAGYPGLEMTVPFAEVVVKVRGEQVVVTGLDHSTIYRLRTTEGDYVFDLTPPGTPPAAVLVIDARFARAHDLQPGDRLDLTLQGVVRQLTVVAINEEILTHFYLPLPYLQEWWGQADRLAHPPNGTLPEAPITGVYLSGDVVSLQKDPALPPYVVEVVEAGELKGQVQELMELFTFYVNLFYLIGIVMGLLIIGNAAVLNLLEREGELATLKTLGTPDGTLGRMIALENLFFGLVGGALGALLAYPVTGHLLTKFTGELFYVPLAMPLGLPLGALALLVLLSLLATWPAILRLRRFDLAEAVRAIER